MENESVYSGNIGLRVEQLKMLSALLMGLDEIRIELTTNEVNSLGFILADIAADLKETDAIDEQANTEREGKI